MKISLNQTFLIYKNQTPNRVYEVSRNYSAKPDTVSFKSANVDKEDAYNLRNIKDLTCACCRKKMIPEADFEKLKARDFEGPAVNVLKKLKPYYKKMRPTEKTVYNLLCRASRKDPQADLNTLIRKRYFYHLSRLEEKQLKIINNIMNEAQNVSPQTQQELEKIINKTKEIIFVESKEYPQKRGRIIKEFAKLKKIKQDKKEISKILKEIEKLPSAKNDVDAFITKYKHRGNREIGQRLLSTALPTLDHIIPKLKSGHDEFGNMLVLCEKCNSERGSIPYPIWFKIHPDMPDNIQKNMDIIIKEINLGRLKNFDNYPLEVKNTLKKVTQHCKKQYDLNIEKLKQTTDATLSLAD